MKKLIIIIAGLLCLFGAFILVRRFTAPKLPATSRFEKVVIAGEKVKSGIFDPSVEYGPDGIGWLAYSWVDVPARVETHLARSTDHGKTWTYVSTLNHSAKGSQVVDGTARHGVWRYETPTLVYDSEDVPARRWKLFVERYLAVPPYKHGDSLHGDGWIEYQYAANPEGPWSKAIRLFGKPQSHSRVNVDSLSPDLAGISFYNEMGSVAAGGTLYLSMDASATPSGLGQWKKRKIILISSKDHGATWKYVGTLTDYADASHLGYLVLTASSLVKVGGQYYLFVSPAGAKGLFKRNRGHDGTIVVEFTDLSQARLQRDAQGHMVVLKWIKPDLNEGGESDYDEQNTAGGIVFPQINLHAHADYFQIFNTKINLVPKP